MRKLIFWTLMICVVFMTACSGSSGDPNKPAFDDVFYQRMDQAAAVLLPELLTTQQDYYKDTSMAQEDAKALEKYAKDFTEVIQKGAYSEYLKLVPFEKDNSATKQLFYTLQAMAERYKFQLDKVGYQAQGDNEAMLMFNWSIKSGPVKNGLLPHAYIMIKGDDGVWVPDRPADKTTLCAYNFDLMLLKVPDFMPEQKDNAVFTRQEKADILKAVNDLLNALAIGDIEQLESMLYNKDIIPDEYKQMLENGISVPDIKLDGQAIVSKISDGQAAVSIKARSSVPNLNGRAQLVLHKTNDSWQLESLY